MTDNTTETASDAAETPQEAAQDPRESATPTDAPAEVVEPQEDAQGQNKEAAKYRRQLREVESERDLLTAQLAVARVATLERHGRSAHILPGAVGEVFPDPNAVFAPDGTIDTAAYNALFDAARKERPYLFQKYEITSAALGRANSGDLNLGPSFESAFTPKSQR